VNRNQKTDLVKTLRGTFEDSASVVVVHCMGLTVAESTDLRTKMKMIIVLLKLPKIKSLVWH
jgi:ribosomal protein L10